VFHRTYDAIAASPIAIGFVPTRFLKANSRSIWIINSVHNLLAYDKRKEKNIAVRIFLVFIDLAFPVKVLCNFTCG
jgi:hypothetical protein